MTLLSLAMFQFSANVSETWIPIVAVIAGCAMVIAIVAIGAITKQRIAEMEHTLQMRRMEHERRMKELEIELARVNAGALARQ